MHRHPLTAAEMKYRQQRTQEIFDLLEINPDGLEAYDDWICGEDYLQAVRDGRISPEDPVLMLSIDGAQLYRSKTSNCWIYIWIILDFAPDGCFSKARVAPGGAIPGPNNPKVMESYLYPSFHHLAALQREGLLIWNATTDIHYLSHPFLYLKTADAPAIIYMNGLVGHRSKIGCRHHCNIKGRLRGKRYYLPCSSRAAIIISAAAITQMLTFSTMQLN